MIADTITKQIGEAMKARDEVRLSTLRMLSSALNYEKIAKQHDLNEDEEIDVVKREAKKRNEAIEIYKNAGAAQRQEREEKELAVLKEFLPEQMTDGELIKLVDEAIAQTGVSNMSGMGQVIGIVMQKVGSKADGSRVAELAKSKLGG